MDIPDEITGIVERCIFHNEQNGFTVFTLKVNARETVTVCGHLSSIHAGEQTTVRGSWITHPKFGKQFQAQECIAQAPTTLLGLKKYLSSGLIKGIGPVYAQKLLDHFGTHVLTVIEQTPERLAEVPGIGAQRTNTIIEAWKDQREIANIMVFLREKGVSAAYATKLFKHYKQQTLTVIQENPYRLATEVWGIGFKTADTIAQQLGFAFDCPARIKAGIIHVITTAATQGHLYCTLESLQAEVRTLLTLTHTHQPLLEGALEDLHHAQTIVIIPHEQQHMVTLSQYHACEKAVATRLHRLLEQSTTHTVNIEPVYHALRTAHDITLTDDQQRAVLACLQSRITIITGGPGTGKTTIIKKLLDILEQHQVAYKLAAPTGRAAKRISESTGRYAATLHRLLEFDPSTMRFVHNEQNALALKYLIVDESSMIDTFLMHALVKALPFDAHLVLIGDVDQLPSVGAGNVLRDLIASMRITTIRLRTIFRQAHDSLIIVNAHRINNGEFPAMHLETAERDFILLKEQDPTKIMEHMARLYPRLAARYHLNWHQSMILAPMNRGTAGTHALNSALQQLLNPQANVLTHGATAYAVGDRVMQIRNNYDKQVFNGDIGYIEAINSEDRTLSIRFTDTVLLYESHEFDELCLAYAISIHKSQGSEFPVVIIPLFMQHFVLLQRNLLYTAVTRARKLCILIGQPQAIALAVKNNKEVARLTLLKELLAQQSC